MRAATTQADAFSAAAYPDCAACRILLNYLQLRTWRYNEPQFAAGIALLMDMASPIFDSDDVIKEWLAISVDSFEACRAAGELQSDVTPLDAAEMLVVMNLSALLFGRHIRLESPDVKDLRVTRFVLTALGVPDVDQHADSVIEDYVDKIPGLVYLP